MTKVQVGDLVCMYRRKNKGMGIVLEYTDDIIVRADAGVTFEEFMNNMTSVENYEARTAYRRELCKKAKNPDMIVTCSIYNASWAKKPKKEFVRIRWFQPPSLYETNEVKETEQWCPIDWVKKL